MLVWLKNILYDPTSFANFLRAGLFLAGEVLTALGPTGETWWAGKAIQSLALVVRATPRQTPPATP